MFLVYVIFLSIFRVLLLSCSNIYVICRFFNIVLGGGGGGGSSSFQSYSYSSSNNGRDPPVVTTSSRTSHTRNGVWLYVHVHIV